MELYRESFSSVKISAWFWISVFNVLSLVNLFPYWCFLWRYTLSIPFLLSPQFFFFLSSSSVCASLPDFCVDLFILFSLKYCRKSCSCEISSGLLSNQLLSWHYQCWDNPEPRGEVVLRGSKISFRIHPKCWQVEHGYKGTTSSIWNLPTVL